MTFWKRQHHRDRKQIRVFMGQEWERLTTKGSRKLLGLMELLYILTMVVVKKLMCLSKLIGLYTKRENFTVYKLYLNKSDLKKKKKGRVHEEAWEETKKTMVVWSLNQKKNQRFKEAAVSKC